MDMGELITHSIIAANGVDELIRKATWQNKVRKTRQKITDLLFEARERSISDKDEVMGLRIIETLMFLQSRIHPTNLKVYQFHTWVIMLSDAGVDWCNLVRGIITGKFSHQLFHEVEK
jgi:hypothetical protein